MGTFYIFLIIFFAILILFYPIFRIVYFFSSKKNVRNKILNLIIILIDYIIVYFVIRNNISSILNRDLGNFINYSKEIILLFATIIIGSVIETIINTIINFFIIRRMKNRE